MPNLSDFITTTSETRPLTLDELVAAFGELDYLFDSPMPNHILMSKDTYRRMRSANNRYFGVKIRGCKGVRTVRFRKGRWQVI